MTIITDPLKLKARADGKKKQFREVVEKINRMKGRDVDSLFHELHAREFMGIDCTSCANCCKNLGPRLTSRDVERMAAGMKIKTSEFFEKYVTLDEDNDYVFKSMPCPLLQEDNLCSVYDFRPAACRNYPHTDQKNIIGIANTCLLNTGCCPVVFKIFNSLSSTLR